jgi:serine phosphatase RsbU (regulator of sigma subunit)
VSERRSPDIFATLATARIDVASGRAVVHTVGHPPPVLVAGANATTLPVPPSVSMGLIPPEESRAGHADRACEVRLPPGGWSLLLYTDGLTDAHRQDDWLGTDGVCELIMRYQATGGPLDKLPAYLAEQAELHNGGPLADDVAMLLLTGGGA